MFERTKCWSLLGDLGGPVGACVPPGEDEEGAETTWGFLPGFPLPCTCWFWIGLLLLVSIIFLFHKECPKKQ